MKLNELVSDTERARNKVDDSIEKTRNIKTPAPVSQAGRDGVQLLSDVSEYIKRFVSFPDNHALTAITLWSAHAHMVQYFHTSPRIALLSPEPESGKTRALEILNTLVPNSMLCISPSPATVFRTLSSRNLTLLLDECDTIFTKKGKSDTNEELRALLNSGYKRGATIPRCVGPNHEVKDFRVFCAVALAGLGDLPDTIMSRSVIIRMRRRAAGENVEPYRTRVHESEGITLCKRLAEWAEIVGEDTGNAWPELPERIVDRAAEVWEPLIAIADAAGGLWPDLARNACVSLSRVARDRKASLGIRLLSDLKIIFGDSVALTTQTILKRLMSGEKFGLDADAPWNELSGKPISERFLASTLKSYGVSPKKVKVNGEALQGYRYEVLWDAWNRYLPPCDTATTEPSDPSRKRGNAMPSSGGSGKKTISEPVKGNQNTQIC